MSPARSWRDVKAEAHRLYPQMADPAVQARARAELDAYVAGHHLNFAFKVDVRFSCSGVVT